MGIGKLEDVSNSQRGNDTMCPSLKSFSVPLIFLGVLILSIACEPVLPYQVKSVLYAISGMIKDVLIFCLPFIIFSLVVNSVHNLGKKALKYILIIVPLICASNFMNTMLSYGTTSLLNGNDFSITSLTSVNKTLEPAFSINLSPLISNDIALLSGVILGLLIGIRDNSSSEKITKYLCLVSNIFFKCLLPVMPLFIIGTALKLQHDGVIASIVSKYLSILVAYVIAAYGMVFLQLVVLAKFSFAKLTTYIQNIMPAIVTAFGSMSSAVAMPLSIKAAEQNVENQRNADIIIPATVNIHLVGDCFFIPMVALAVMMSFGIEMPSFGAYAMFALHFILAKFAVAAIPGGGVLVMLPIMQTYLGLNSDMLALVTAIYILFDPIITACNVAGNGSMAIIFDKLVEKFK